MTPQAAADPIGRYVAAFETLERGLDGGVPSPVHRLRRSGIEAFRRIGFPTPRDEAWKTVSLAPLIREAFEPVPEEARRGVSSEQAAPFTFAGTPGPLLVFVDGWHDHGLSAPGPLPAGVKVGSLAAALDAGDGEAIGQLARHAAFDGHAFAALNTAFMRDGAYLFVPRGAEVEAPIRILHLSSGTAGTVSHPRNLIVVEPGGRVTIVETYAGLDGGPVFTNAVSEIWVGEDAVVEHCRLGLDAPGAFHVGGLHIDQAARSRVTAHAVTLGGGFVRNDVTSVLGGEGSGATLNGFYFLEGGQHVDNYTSIEHERPGCPSHELYKGILGGRSRAIFRGRIHVHPDAQGTDAYQSNRNLLLTDEARVDTKPQLEIYADEVKCSHGATVGQLDEDAFFYLRSRGIGVEAARRILLEAFAGEIIGRIGVEPVREALSRMVLNKFERIEERTEEER
jgi:Fe-S cluster assembly protein SufD